MLVLRSHDVTILYRSDKTNTPSVNLYPLVVNPQVSDFAATGDLDWVLRHDKNRCLLMVGWFRGKGPSDAERALLDRLRAKYEVLAYFDESDGTEIQHAMYLPWFDLWYKKQLLRDRSRYLLPFRGNRFFTEYYIDKYGVKDDPEPAPLTPVAPSDLPKLRLGWNILLGVYPIRPLVRRAAAGLVWAFGLKASRLLVPRTRWRSRPRPDTALCHARFGWGSYRPTVDYQRRVFLERVAGKPDFLAGRVPPAQYERELRSVRGVLSPFGWGEVCYRDSEAVRSGAVLFKPDMGHLETWPDLYRPGETYIPLAWDASDVESHVAEVLRDEEKSVGLVRAAWELLADAEAGLAKRLRDVAEEIRSYRKPA